jgi:hypothetical protein
VFEAQLIFPLNGWHNHASSLVECPNGDLLACWFSGSGERTADDVQILGARRRKGATRWSQPFPMADTPDYPDCNPVLFINARRRLWLVWITILNHRWEGSLLKYRACPAHRRVAAHRQRHRAGTPPTRRLALGRRGAHLARRSLLGAHAEGRGRYAYPCAIQARDGTITYSYALERDDLPRDEMGRPKRSAIKWARFDREWLLQGDSSGIL